MTGLRLCWLVVSRAPLPGSAELKAGYQRNSAHRVDPSDDADDYGFEELTLGLGLSLNVD